MEFVREVVQSVLAPLGLEADSVIPLEEQKRCVYGQYMAWPPGRQASKRQDGMETNDSVVIVAEGLCQTAERRAKGIISFKLSIQTEETRHALVMSWLEEADE